MHQIGMQTLQSACQSCGGQWQSKPIDSQRRGEDASPSYSLLDAAAAAQWKNDVLEWCGRQHCHEACQLRFRTARGQRIDDVHDARFL